MRGAWTGNHIAPLLLPASPACLTLGGSQQVAESPPAPVKPGLRQLLKALFAVPISPGKRIALQAAVTLAEILHVSRCVTQALMGYKNR